MSRTQNFGQALTLNIRAKFQLQEVREHASNSGGKTFVFRPCYDTSIPEDQVFMKYSPTGEFSIFVTNPVVLAEWTLDEHYYFDVTPVPAEAQIDAA